MRTGAFPAWSFLLPAVMALLGACTPLTRLPDPAFDPLPPLFPVQVRWPTAEPGWSCTPPATLHGRAERICTHLTGARLTASVGFAGAYVDGSEAIDQLWPSLLAQQDVQTDASPRAAPLRAIRPASGPSRTGRSLWIAPDRLLALFVVDPWVLEVRVDLPASTAADQARPLAEDAVTALIARLQPDPAVLCDPRVAVLRVPWGLSNVASHGRVVFVSQEVDHLDASTIAELRRLASMRREQAGCPPLQQDFSAVEAALRRHSRSR